MLKQTPSPTCHTVHSHSFYPALITACIDHTRSAICSSLPAGFLNVRVVYINTFFTQRAKKTGITRHPGEAWKPLILQEASRLSLRARRNHLAPSQALPSVLALTLWSLGPLSRCFLFFRICQARSHSDRQRGEMEMSDMTKNGLCVCV